MVISKIEVKDICTFYQKKDWRSWSLATAAAENNNELKEFDSQENVLPLSVDHA
jgi:hypothetical protein